MGGHVSINPHARDSRLGINVDKSTHVHPAPFSFTGQTPPDPIPTDPQHPDHPERLRAGVAQVRCEWVALAAELPEPDRGEVLRAVVKLDSDSARCRPSQARARRARLHPHHRELNGDKLMTMTEETGFKLGEQTENLADTIQKLLEAVEKLNGNVEALNETIETFDPYTRVQEGISDGIGMLGEDETVLAIRSLPGELRETREALNR